MGLDKYLVSVSVSQLPSFLCGGIEIDLISEWGSNWLDFRRWAEINLIFVLEIELDLVLVLGSKVTCFLCGRSKLTVCGLKLTYFESDDRLIWFCVSDGGQNWLGFCMWAVNRLVLVWASKLTWFCMGGRCWLDFNVVDWTRLDFSLGIGNDLGRDGGSKMT